MFCFCGMVFFLLLLFLTDNKMKGLGKKQSCNSGIIRHAPMFGGNWLMLFLQCSSLRFPSLRYRKIKLPLEMPLLFQSPCGSNYCFLEKEISKRVSHVMDGYNSTSHLSEHTLRTTWIKHLQGSALMEILNKYWICLATLYMLSDTLLHNNITETDGLL